LLQIDLFSLREKIINITQSVDKVNPDKVKKNFKQEKWKAGEDVENLGQMLTKYLTNASQFAHLAIST
jgi:predicted DNA binding CopG/RHH family protein